MMKEFSLAVEVERVERGAGRGMYLREPERSKSALYDDDKMYDS